MPNWCNNGITLRHADPAMIDRVIKGKEGLLMEFLPTPAPLLDTIAGSYGDEAKDQQLKLKQLENIEKFGAKDWYDWNCNNWGTKWDFSFDSVERINDNTVQASFDSAWAPPIGAYRKLCALGFEIEAMYYEPGMCFAGKFTGDEESEDDEYYEFGGATSETVRELIGEELDDYFAVSESMAEWEEDNQE
jgi:hypothetical protein